MKKTPTLVLVFLATVLVVIYAFVETSKRAPAPSSVPTSSVPIVVPTQVAPTSTVPQGRATSTESVSEVTVSQPATPTGKFAADLYHLTNQDRKAGGVEALTYSSALEKAAYGKLADMTANHYFAHVSPAGLYPWDWFKGVSYDFRYAGENLGEGYYSPQEFEVAFMASPTHRENILKVEYQEVGIAYGQMVCPETCNQFDAGHLVNVAVVMFGAK